MREIKFRGIPLFGKEFVYGSLIIDTNENGEKVYIIRRIESGKVSTFEVKEETVGQYTGLKDAINKNEVYEHDIINLLGVGFLKVEWDYRYTGWICLDKHYKKRNLADVLFNGGIRVGNIYENPELLN